MKKTASFSCAVDSASILFLSLMRKEHTNSFRFTMTMQSPVCPEALQTAMDRVWKRMPSVVAAIRPGFFHFRQVHASEPPQVRPDPGFLKVMLPRERENCCFRVYYDRCDIIIELFHALTDGYGAITTLITLVSEYLLIREGIRVPPCENRLDVQEAPLEAETSDDYLPLASAKPMHLPSRFSYLPPKPADTDWNTRVSSISIETKLLLEAAHRQEVTLNTLLTAVMAASLMEMQLRSPGRKRKPVRIMVPANMRRMFGSRTLRNFSLYALPTMEVSQKDQSLKALCDSIGRQLKQDLSKERLASMASYNARTQNLWLFRILPWKLKGAAMRLGYRFFGESNSSLTLTNLGNAAIPEVLKPHVRGMNVYMTPRAGVPYGCTVLSFGDKLTVNLSKFTDDTELEDLFFGKLKALTEE